MQVLCSVHIGQHLIAGRCCLHQLQDTSQLVWQASSAWLTCFNSNAFYAMAGAEHAACKWAPARLHDHVVYKHVYVEASI